MKTNHLPAEITLSTEEFVKVYNALQVLRGTILNIQKHSYPLGYYLHTEELLLDVQPYLDNAEGLIKTLSQFIPVKKDYCENSFNTTTGELFLAKTKEELLLMQINDQLSLRQNCEYEKLDIVYRGA